VALAYRRRVVRHAAPEGCELAPGRSRRRTFRRGVRDRFVIEECRGTLSAGVIKRVAALRDRRAALANATGLELMPPLRLLPAAARRDDHRSLAAAPAFRYDRCRKSAGATEGQARRSFRPAIRRPRPSRATEAERRQPRRIRAVPAARVTAAPNRGYLHLTPRGSSPVAGAGAVPEIA